MTATWDRIQTFLKALGELKDPDLYETGLRCVADLFEDQELRDKVSTLEKKA